METEFDKIVQKHKKLFFGFIRYDIIKTFPLSNRRSKITAFYHLFHIPKEIQGYLNKKTSQFYYKIRGYSFDEIQNMNISSKNSHTVEYLVNSGFEPSFSKKLALEIWENWGIVPKKKYPNCSGNKLHYISRGWDDETANRLAEESRIKNTEAVKSSIKSQNRWKRNNNQFTVGFWMERGYSEENAKIKVEERFSSNRSHRTTQYWIEKGYSPEDAKIKVSEFQSQSGKKMWEKAKENDTWWKNSPKSTRYWTEKGYSLEDAKEKISDSQKTFSLKICIEKHGEENGKKIWEERQEKWIETMQSKSEEEVRNIRKKQSSGNLEWALTKTENNEEKALELLKDLGKKKDVYSWEALLRRTGGNAEEATILRDKHLKRILDNNGKYYSKESIKVLEPIYEYTVSLLPDSKIYWKENEYFLRKNKTYMYDFTVLDIKMIIEYNGTYWHPKEGDVNWKTSFKTYEEAIEKDKEKEKIALENGFSYYVIWSDDDIQKVSKHLMEIIHEKIENHTRKFI